MTMSDLSDLVARTHPPEPWVDGDNIPWDEPGFSRRMLDEHLTQDHDLASRRTAIIDDQVEWIHTTLLERRPSRILDLGCGPGLYLNRLARLGHRGVGIDFSPASIEHARGRVTEENPPIEYLQADLRSAEFGGPFDLAMILYGQINVFRRDDASSILRRAVAALSPGGVLLLEPQSVDHVRATGAAPPTWSTHDSGLFSDRPHLLLVEAAWHEEARTTVERFHVVDAATGSVEIHGLSSVAYDADELVSLLTEAGVATIDIRPSLAADHPDPNLMVMVGRT